MRRLRASSRSATSRATNCTGSATPSIESGASTAASAPCAIAKPRLHTLSWRDRQVGFRERLLARVRSDAGPGLDRPVAAAQRGVALGHLFGADLHHAL